MILLYSIRLYYIAIFSQACHQQKENEGKPPNLGINTFKYSMCCSLHFTWKIWKSKYEIKSHSYTLNKHISPYRARFLSSDQSVTDENLVQNKIRSSVCYGD